ncbi:MAG TPA: TIGR03086 family metal-binding protein, partial [Microthrixaceae bacterium]|nr:TIGR03086 family metal-binding protein [Microthrixaceae bacterium]HNJ23216.1 TIGR03086 family metal-binding protein [Microthrixaceae bacterium]
MEPTALAQAQDIAAGLLAQVGADQLQAPTPCAEWNVGQLIDHMVGTQDWARAAIDGVELTDTGDGASADDFRARYADAAAACLAAFQADGALERTVDPGFGEMPAAALLGIATTDTFTHAWDLATALDLDNDLDPELAELLLDNAHRAIPPSFRTEDGSIFRAEQDAPAGA